tara:strand:+ start:141 stop:872 length:732 start_codon:yes stop_codon:yes gene_type:complete
MALPALIPVIMMGGRIIGRIASKRLAGQLAGKLGKGQRIVNKPASQAKNVPNVTSVNQARNLKPPTKVVGKGPAPASIRTGAPKSPKKPLRADPKDRISTPAKKAKTTATGTSTQKKIVGAGLTAASLSGLLPDRKGSGKSQAGTKSGPSTKTTVSDAQKRGQVRKNQTTSKADKNKSKSFKDYKSVAAAQKDNSNFFMGRDGKKKLAVTAEQLKKSGLSLNAMANKVRAGSSIKQLIAKRNK